MVADAWPGRWDTIRLLRARFNGVVPHSVLSPLHFQLRDVTRAGIFPFFAWAPTFCLTCVVEGVLWITDKRGSEPLRLKKSGSTEGIVGAGGLRMRNKLHAVYGVWIVQRDGLR